GMALSTPGLLAGIVFFAFSLTPSLVPRPSVVQGIVSGLSFSIGYALGVAAQWLWSYLEIPAPPARTLRWISIGAAAACAVVAVVFLWHAATWQNSVRSLMQMEETHGGGHLTVALITLLLFGLLLLVARLFRMTKQFLAARLHGFVPRRVSRLIGAIAAVA